MATTPGDNAQHFPGFDVLAQSGYWDVFTQGVVLSRLRPPDPLIFFTAEQEPTLRALLDRLLDQNCEPRVPVAESVDSRLARRRGDGYRHIEMPEDWVAWPRSIEGLDADAREKTGRPFFDLGPEEQIQLIDHIRQLEGEWHGMPAGRLFELWTRYACDAFYSHPWAWNEIGFGGPAYPRGYKNLGLDRREPWEVAEREPADPVAEERSDDRRRLEARS
jgi:hypothetical protein